MKFIKIFVIIILASAKSFSQEFNPILLEGSLDLYVGTWKYENAETEEVFIIKLKKFENYTTLTNTNFGTVLIGEYFYSKMGTVIYDNLDYISGITANHQAINTSILCFDINQNYANLYLSVIDEVFGKAASGELRYSLTRKNTHTLKWEIAESEGDFDIGPDYQEGLSIPSDITLVKVSE